jgi:hypothetical protein
MNKEVFYMYKGLRYQIMYEASMKIGQAWLPCVVYKRADHDDSYFVREHYDFYEKFTETEVSVTHEPLI